MYLTIVLAEAKRTVPHDVFELVLVFFIEDFLDFI